MTYYVYLAVVLAIQLATYLLGYNTGRRRGLEAAPKSKCAGCNLLDTIAMMIRQRRDS